MIALAFKVAMLPFRIVIAVLLLFFPVAFFGGVALAAMAALGEDVQPVLAKIDEGIAFAREMLDIERS